MKLATEFDVKGHVDVTINRCEINAEDNDRILMLTKYKIGKPTPHMQNDCSGPHYLLQENMADIMEQQFDSPPTISIKVDSTPESCSSSKHVQVLTELQENYIVSDRDNEIFMATQNLHLDSCLPQVEQ